MGRQPQNKIFDLAIVGGGIVGAGIARDAALRGLSVALFEKGDYGGGTTSRSTRLIHGGLRYLETLDFRLVRLDLKEREILLRIAGHLVKPLPFLIPFYGRSLPYRSKVRLGMLLYDLLGFDKSLPPYRHLSRSEMLACEPSLEGKGLQGGFCYYDAQVSSPERLVIENVIDARENGAFACNYTEVIEALREKESVCGVRVRDVLTGSESEVRSRAVVNAGGPWFDQLSRKLAFHNKPRVRMTKGIHVVIPSLTRRAIVFFSQFDNRLFFTVPWQGQSLVGTTDTDFSGDPGNVEVEPSEVEYLLNSLRPFLPGIDRNPPLYCYAGVRALVPDKGDPSSISRMHMIVDEEGNGAPGLVSVIGGKITGYRAIAEEAVDLVCRKLAVRSPCRTATTPLPGLRDRSAFSSPALGSADPETVRYLSSLYGTRTNEILDLANSDSRFAVRLAPGYTPDISAQVIYGVRKEQCIRVSDFLLRRTLLGYLPDQGCRVLPSVISLMGGELGWSVSRKAEEFDAYTTWIQRSRVHQT